MTVLWWMLMAGCAEQPMEEHAPASLEERVGWEAASGWVGAQRRAVPVARPAEGDGVVVNRAGHPVGVSTVQGVTRAVNAVCPHLGGVLAWNDAEGSWDCPLHASRFTAAGLRIEGPAVCDLQRLPRVPGEVAAG